MVMGLRLWLFMVMGYGYGYHMGYVITWVMLTHGLCLWAIVMGYDYLWL